MTHEIISLIANSSKNNSLILESFSSLKWFIFLFLGIFVIESIMAIIRIKTKKQNIKEIIDQLQKIIFIFVTAIFGFAVLIFIIELFRK